VTRTAEGIRNTTTYWDEKHRLRVRPPRYFGSDRLLQVRCRARCRRQQRASINLSLHPPLRTFICAQPYCREKSEGQELLYTLEEGKYQKDYYMYHINIENSVIIISDNHVISINRFNIKLEEWNVQIKGMRSTHSRSPPLERSSERSSELCVCATKALIWPALLSLQIFVASSSSKREY